MLIFEIIQNQVVVIFYKILHLILFTKQFLFSFLVDYPFYSIFWKFEAFKQIKSIKRIT